MRKRVWSRSGVPHTGWKYVRGIKNDISNAVCEMCGQKNIKHLDVLKHENYKGEIKVGQDCSELMMIPGKMVSVGQAQTFLY